MELEHKKPPPFVRPLRKEHKTPPTFFRPNRNPNKDSKILIHPPIKIDNPSSEIRNDFKGSKNILGGNSNKDHRAISFASNQANVFNLYKNAVDANSNSQIQSDIIENEKKSPNEVVIGKQKQSHQEENKTDYDKTSTRDRKSTEIPESTKLQYKLDINKYIFSPKEHKVEDAKPMYKIELKKNKNLQPNLNSQIDEYTNATHNIEVNKRKSTQQTLATSSHLNKISRHTVQIKIQAPSESDSQNVSINLTDNPQDQSISYASTSKSSAFKSILKTRPVEELTEPPSSTLQIDFFEFPNEDHLPAAPIRKPIIMKFPSFAKKTRHDNTKIVTFSEYANIPIAMKSQANLVAAMLTDDLISCPKMKKGVTSLQLERMAKLLARHIFKSKFDEESKSRKLVFN